MAKRVIKKRNPRILIVTPEITYLPTGMGNMSNQLVAKAGGLADVSASLVAALFRQGADVHVALPHYRRMFHIDVGKLINSELRLYKAELSNNRIHLAEDRIFYYRDQVYSNYNTDSLKLALAFQREVINNIIPRVNPDLVHCNDWMTGLIPGFTRRLGIPSLFTVHNIHTNKLRLDEIEDRGIDAAEFWDQLYYEREPFNYEESRSGNQIDLLGSGIFAAHFINTVSPTFLQEIVDGQHDFIPDNIRYEIAAKTIAGCASGILNAPDETFDAMTDCHLKINYDADNHVKGKEINKSSFQKRTGLKVDPQAPLFFWPSRLDPVQKGCQLVTEILYNLTSAYADQGIQIAIVANGDYQQHFRNIVRLHNLHEQVTVCDFDEPLSHLGYAAADFMLMPSRFEPCGLPQMVSPMYGTLSVVHDTGGIHDTVKTLDIEHNSGNGFLFEHYDTSGLWWAIEQAMKFYRQPAAVKEVQIARIMREAKAEFNHDVTARHYIDIYESMLQRPLTA
jgi:ADP-glucose type glycogen/starch synthase